MIILLVDEDEEIVRTFTKFKLCTQETKSREFPNYVSIQNVYDVIRGKLWLPETFATCGGSISFSVSRILCEKIKK